MIDSEAAGGFYIDEQGTKQGFIIDEKRVTPLDFLNLALPSLGLKSKRWLFSTPYSSIFG